MAKKFKTTAGWTVYKVSLSEIIEWGGGGICDSRGELISSGYLIPVMNVCYCKECFDEWEKMGIFYKEDLPIENKRIAYYDSILHLEEG